MVCIDEFAIKKRESYGTIMVDINTHRVIDLIPSRECADVVEWLKTYPNLKIISRDGSITYHNAITTAHPDAVQVSDRFHLLKNLTSYCKDFLMKCFKPKVIIEIPKKTGADTVETQDPSVQNKKLTLAEKSNRALVMLAEGISKTQICRQLNMDIRTLDKLMGMSDEERNLYVKSSMELSHGQKVLKKQELINTVRDMHERKCSIRSIAKELQLSRQTVAKYLDKGLTAVHGSYGVKKKSILDPYLDEINGLIDKGVSSSVIEAEIRQKGYTGSSSTVRHYITRLKKLIQNTYNTTEIKPENTRLLERKLLIKLLFKPVEKIKGLSKECLDIVNNQYPRSLVLH
ncbi:MAG: transposase [Bacillota bacterium]